jgi:hypothetical protein
VVPDLATQARLPVGTKVLSVGRAADCPSIEVVTSQPRIRHPRGDLKKIVSLRRKFGIRQISRQPEPNVIKLYLSVIYEFSE